jgi:hypothetical protein
MLSSLSNHRGIIILLSNCTVTVTFRHRPVYCRLSKPCVLTGGDDVQQLCDAGEEEFLEIMALVGMASKPLHVRRLQKALQEWVSNPGKYRDIPRGNNMSACLVY